ncbi:MAG: hypothetical protein R3A46_04675 [Thermomicrobiales bacterium]
MAYRETISRHVDNVEGRFTAIGWSRTSSGHVVISVEPLDRGEGFVFEDNIVGGAIPREFISPVQSESRKRSTGGPSGSRLLTSKSR